MKTRDLSLDYFKAIVITIGIYNHLIRKFDSLDNPN